MDYQLWPLTKPILAKEKGISTVRVPAPLTACISEPWFPYHSSAWPHSVVGPRLWLSGRSTPTTLSIALWLMPFWQWGKNKFHQIKIWFRVQDTWGVCISCACWLTLCRILEQDALGTLHILGSDQAENMLCVPKVAKKARGFADHRHNFGFV